MSDDLVHDVCADWPTQKACQAHDEQSQGDVQKGKDQATKHTTDQKQYDWPVPGRLNAIVNKKPKAH